MFDQHLAV